MDRSPTLVRGTTSPGRVLHDTRVRLGLTQFQVANLLVATEADIDGCESGTFRPDGSFEQRIFAMAALGDTSAYRSTDYLTIPATAAQLRTQLWDGGESDDVLRLIIQACDDFSALGEPADLELFLMEPATTEDQHYDALLAGLTVHLCRQAGLRTTPAWTREDCRYLDSFWWFGLDHDQTRLRAYNFQRTPSCLRSRGVIFNAEILASV